MQHCVKHPINLPCIILYRLNILNNKEFLTFQNIALLFWTIIRILNFLQSHYIKDCHSLQEIVDLFLQKLKMLSSTQPSSVKSQIFQNIIENEAKGEKGEVENNELADINIEVNEVTSKAKIAKDKRATKTSHPVPLKNYATGQISYDTLHASEEADQVTSKNG